MPYKHKVSSQRKVLILAKNNQISQKIPIYLKIFPKKSYARSTYHQTTQGKLRQFISTIKLKSEILSVLY